MRLKHEKGLCLFTSILFVLYMIAGILLTSCGVKESDQSKEISQAVDSDSAETDSPADASQKDNSPAGDNALSGEEQLRSEEEEPVSATNQAYNEDCSLGPVPEPASDYKTDWGCGIYFSSISYEEVEDYLNRLKEEGWYAFMDPNLGISFNTILSSSEKPAVTEVPAGNTQLLLSDGENLLQLLITIDSKSSAMNNSMLIRLEEGVSDAYVIGRKDALSKLDALRLIQPEVDKMSQERKLSVTKAKITGLFEVFIKDAYEMMGLQAYTAISDTGVTGSFLISKGSVLPVIGYLKDACVADIDGNGRYELLDLFGFGSGIYRIELNIYEYSNPIIFSSLTEILHRKYSNCFIPVKGYAELRFLKLSDSEVRLIGIDIDNGKETDYGKIKIKDYSPVPERLEGFPFKQWKDTYDQSRLSGIDKKIPEKAPEIIVSIDGRSMDYSVTKTIWDGKKENYNTSGLFRQILGKGSFVPTYCVGGITEVVHTIEINFGDSMPDTIKVKDAMMMENGKIRYGEKQIMDRDIEILDDSRVQFGLMQHMSYYLSSNLEDYEKDWYRLFHVICTWGDNEAVYTFVINTGSEDKLTEVDDHEFLQVDGTFSMFSSSWGVGFQVKASSVKLPKRYIIEWQISDGEIKSWNQGAMKPIYITDRHNGYPMTSSEDSNFGAVIWTPASYEEGDKATIKAYIYRNREDRSPVAVAKINMIFLNNFWRVE